MILMSSHLSYMPPVSLCASGLHLCRKTLRILQMHIQISLKATVRFFSKNTNGCHTHSQQPSQGTMQILSKHSCCCCHIVMCCTFCEKCTFNRPLLELTVPKYKDLSCYFLIWMLFEGTIEIKHENVPRCPFQRFTSKCYLEYFSHISHKINALSICYK